MLDDVGVWLELYVAYVHTTNLKTNDLHLLVGPRGLTKSNVIDCISQFCLCSSRGIRCLNVWGVRLLQIDAWDILDTVNVHEDPPQHGKPGADRSGAYLLLFFFVCVCVCVCVCLSQGLRSMGVHIPQNYMTPARDPKQHLF